MKKSKATANEGFWTGYVNKLIGLRIKSFNWKDWLLSSLIVMSVIGSFSEGTTIQESIGGVFISIGGFVSFYWFVFLILIL